MKTFYVRANRETPQSILVMRENDAEQVSIDWSAKAAYMETSVSSVTWTVDSGNASVSGASETADIATALVTATDTNDSTILVKATFADGQIETIKLSVLVAI